MAIGFGDGGELQAPLARVVIGGLLASTAVTRARHDTRSNLRMSIPSISIAPRCGSYNRHKSFASVVLPAPFCPTMASDEPAGIARSKPSSTAAPLVYEKVTSRSVEATGIPRQILGSEQRLTVAPIPSDYLRLWSGGDRRDCARYSFVVVGQQGHLG